MDWLAAIFELTGDWVVGNRRRLGFLLKLVGCGLWIAVALRTGVYGLLLVVVPALLVNSRNWWTWRET